MIFPAAVLLRVRRDGTVREVRTRRRYPHDSLPETGIVIATSLMTSIDDGVVQKTPCSAHTMARRGPTASQRADSRAQAASGLLARSR